METRSGAKRKMGLATRRLHAAGHNRFLGATLNLSFWGSFKSDNLVQRDDFESAFF